MLKAKAKDLTLNAKAKAKAKDSKFVLEDSSRPRTKAKDNNTDRMSECSVTLFKPRGKFVNFTHVSMSRGFH